MESEFFRQGYHFYWTVGTGIEKCPYPTNSKAYCEWRAGYWHGANEEAEIEEREERQAYLSRNPF